MNWFIVSVYLYAVGTWALWDIRRLMGLSWDAFAIIFLIGWPVSVSLVMLGSLIEMLKTLIKRIAP